MGTFIKKHKTLEKEIIAVIEQLIKAKGVESKHRGDVLVLKVKDDQQFNLDGGRYLTEITSNELIDNQGYNYNLSVLSLEQLCEVVDNL